MKIKSYAMHQIDINDYASTEHWYYTYHGPQLARRYGPWLDRFESYRPVPAPGEAKAYGLTNYLCTVGIWNGVPERGAKGELALTSPKVHAHPFHFLGPVQCTEDFKGSQIEPCEKAVLRWVQMFRYPRGIDKRKADDWYLNSFSEQACECESMFRFFSFRALEDGIHLPGEWKKDTYKDMKGKPEDHEWDRLSEMWFEDYSGWKQFVEKSFTAPEWAIHEHYPFVKPEKDYRSCFLLERPDYDWLKSNHCFL
jgi:hypothetical protein